MRRERWSGPSTRLPATQGDTVVTNIDLGLQEAVQTALQNDITADKHTVDPSTEETPTANDGAAVVLDAQTGAVLAMASYPTYDLNVWLGGISQANYSALSAGCNTTSTTTGCPLINYAIDGLYTPGSTFKLNTATAALDDGVINANQYVDDTGVYHVPQKCTSGCTYTDDEASDAGETDLAEALTEVRRLLLLQSGRPLLLLSRIPTASRRWRPSTAWARPTGIDLPGEDMGQVDSAALRASQHKESPTAFPYPSYYVGDNIETAFGQGETLVTPVQQAVAYATFANGGTRYQPAGGSCDRQPDRQAGEADPAQGHRDGQPAAFDLPAHAGGLRGCRLRQVGHGVPAVPTGRTLPSEQLSDRREDGNGRRGRGQGAQCVVRRLRPDQPRRQQP